MNSRLMCIFFLFLVVEGLLASGSIIFPCVTPNAEKALCQSLFKCPHLMQSLSTLDPSAIAFVQQSICLGCEAGDFMVCCGKASNFVELNNCSVGLNLNNNRNQSNGSSVNIVSSPASRDSSSSSNVTKANATTATSAVEINTNNLAVVSSTQSNDIERHREHVATNILPSLEFCGQQHTDDRLPDNTNTTALDEFPWLVHLHLSDNEYDGEFGDRCNGVLISRRYILTDAYCGYEAVRAVMGQYITGQNRSCFNSSEFIEDCTDEVKQYRIHSKVRSGKRANGPFNIMLLRLKKEVLYTDYIRPICLPLNGTKREDNNLIFSGWGAEGPQGIVKKRLVYDVVNPEVCYKASPGVEGNVKFANVSMACVSPLAGNTDKACNGEHGGPFMYRHRRRFYVDGIIVEAYGAGCSNKDPLGGIFITPTMMNWILDNIHD